MTIDDEPAAKLARLAARMHVQPGTLARSLLTTAIDDADPDATTMTALLDGIDGAWERIDAGVRQAHAGETIALDDL